MRYMELIDDGFRFWQVARSVLINWIDGIYDVMCFCQIGRDIRKGHNE